MKKQKEDLYIKILAYGKQNIGHPIKYSEIQSYLDNEGYDYDEFSLRQLFSDLFINKHNPHGNDPSSVPPEDGEFFLEHNGYFNLLEHEELQSARKSSLLATIFASVAILISIVSTSISIYYSNKQLNTPVKLDATQITKLSGPIKIDTTQLNKMDNTTITRLLENIKSQNQSVLQDLDNLKKQLTDKNTHNNML